MTFTSAIGNLITAIWGVITGIIQTIWAAVYGVLSTVLATVHGILSILWSNIGLLLVIGFAILIYQIFVVDKSKSRAPALSHRVGAGQKKVA